MLHICAPRSETQQSHHLVEEGEIHKEANPIETVGFNNLIRYFASNFLCALQLFYD